MQIDTERHRCYSLYPWQSLSCQVSLQPENNKQKHIPLSFNLNFGRPRVLIFNVKTWRNTALQCKKQAENISFDLGVPSVLLLFTISKKYLHLLLQMRRPVLAQN